ncbi:MAG: penicillin-binding protein 2 [Caldithrix sp.]|nr:penicillin-binding protein 2 [Caldithrix sp.]
MEILERSALQNRFYIYTIILLMAFTLLVYGFFRIQVHERDVYVEQSIENSVRKVQVYPVRGLIKDRNQRILVDNRPVFTAAAIPKVISDSSLKRICSILQADLKKVKKRLQKEYGYQPIVISRDINQQDLIYLEENRLSFPGLVILKESKRHYPEGVNSPHIFGMVGEVTDREKLLNPVYTLGDMVGKTGLEKEYDMEIRGSKGVEYKRVDAAGRVIGNYDTTLNVDPVHGSDLFLKLDYEQQQFAESLFVENRGALVAIDVRDGGILSLVSRPDFDPRLLTGKIDPQIWKTLLNDEDHPLFSRAIQSTYPPGSTYKIVAAIAALEEDIITQEWTAHCPGYFRIGRKIVHCWKSEGHGTVNLLEAIKGSCNVYFYQLGLKIGLDVWAHYSQLLGFGKITGIDLPNEDNGLVPTRRYFNRVYGENGWTRGNLANLAIGQGELLTTPLQLAQFAMILANKGVYHKPHLVTQIYNYETNETADFPVETHYIDGISDKVYHTVHEGMHRVVNGGTGWLGKVQGIDMAGKTGTAQNPHGDTHAWFMAFAPYEFPEVAVAVIVENAGGGGAVAAPLARKFLEKYFYDRIIPRVYAQPDTSDSEEEDFQPIFRVDTVQSLPINQ